MVEINGRREGGLIDMGVEQGFIRKSGSWFTYEGEQLGQGKENARTFLIENVDIGNEYLLASIAVVVIAGCATGGPAHFGRQPGQVGIQRQQAAPQKAG